MRSDNGAAEAGGLFGQAWAASLGGELRRSEAFRRAAAGWQGTLVLELLEEPAADGGQRGVLIELADGVCRQARASRPADRERAAFVIAGGVDGWQGVLAGSASPLTALLRGRLRLVKGKLTSLMPFAAAAEELARCAARLVGAGAAPAAAEAPRRPPFRSTSAAGLATDSPPMQLWEKAKRHGIWNPRAIDFTTDRRQWLELDDEERDLLLRLAALFGGGEESVTRELLPLIRVIAREGRLEEEMFLTAFLWEEAKHVEAFRLFFDEVAGEQGDLDRYHTPAWRRIFCHELPAAMARLDDDRSAVAQARASVTYNMIVEGVLAETGYHVYHSVLVERDILPGTREMVGYLQRDESRHLAYGVYLLTRLVEEHGEPVWQAIEQRMDELLQPALAIVQEVFDLYPPGGAPFGLEASAFLDYANGQFERRLERIDRGRRGRPPGSEPSNGAGGPQHLAPGA